MPLEDVKDEILTQLINQKKVEKVLADCKAQVSGSESLEALAEKFGTTVNHKDGISFTTMDMSTEPCLLGAVASAPAEKVVGPVKGSIGAYYFQVNNATSGEYYTEADANSRNAQKAFTLLQNLTQIISQDTDVKDYRAKFY